MPALATLLSRCSDYGWWVLVFAPAGLALLGERTRARLVSRVLQCSRCVLHPSCSRCIALAGSPAALACLAGSNALPPSLRAADLPARRSEQVRVVLVRMAVNLMYEPQPKGSSQTGGDPWHCCSSNCRCCCCRCCRLLCLRQGFSEASPSG